MGKKRTLIVTLTILLILASIGFLFVSRSQISKKHKLMTHPVTQKDVYFCPMHPGFTSDKPGSCAICGMTLVKKEEGHEEHAGMKKERKILYYRNPMNPQVTSSVPMKDQMGMDYVPVYEEEASTGEKGIYISPEKQQMVGIKKEVIEKRNLFRQIRTVGKIAYDPELYVAQEEYLQALKMQIATQNSNLASVIEQSKSLVEAAEKKLLLLGMSQEQIQELANRGKPQENLYLPINENTVWAYLTIYEYDIGSIKEGMPVEIETVAFPGEVFAGKIASILPVLDPATRSVQARAEVDNSNNKLRPEMFVDARININLGEKLAVPDEAVLNTGERQVVFIAQPQGYFVSREVKLGQKAGNYFEVLSGLNEGDAVVSSGNFFVDSESRLKSAITPESHQHNQ